MRNFLLFGVIAAIAAFFIAGDDQQFVKSILHGFEWGIGREVAHHLFHHVIH